MISGNFPEISQKFLGNFSEISRKFPESPIPPIPHIPLPHIPHYHIPPPPHPTTPLELQIRFSQNYNLTTIVRFFPTPFRLQLYQYHLVPGTRNIQLQSLNVSINQIIYMFFW